MKVLLSGSSGLVGSALKQNLESDGHEVAALPRTHEIPIDFTDADAVVHLAGESIASGRWTVGKKRRIEASRVVGTAQLAEQIKNSSIKPGVFISASAVGYYGDRGNEILDESSLPGEGFLPDVCKKWEEATRPAEEAGVRTVRIRTGIVLSTRGGALVKMLPPFKLGGGGVLGSGNQYMSWISLDDMVAIIRFLMDHDETKGSINLVSPDPATNAEFTKTLGKALHRPAFFPLPAFAARLLFGEMADALLLSSTRVKPKKLLEAGYEFKYPTLKTALEHILQ